MTNFKLPPINKDCVPTGKELANRLQPLIGIKIPLTNKPRANGANLRKAIIKVLDDGTIRTANKTEFSVVPLKGKGIPRILACLCESYIVTSGNTYNLQVWNRFPDSENDLIRYNDNQTIKCKDIRFIFVKVDCDTNEIQSVVIATPDYIVKNFGAFGVPTIKYQMIVSNLKRKDILNCAPFCYFKEDTANLQLYTSKKFFTPKQDLSEMPERNKILSLQCIKDRVCPLIGKRLVVSDTKTKGQALERMVADLLGYSTNNSLVGTYPDIPNQLLEIKVQDSPTIDLGMYSPSNPVVINSSMNLTTEDVRYLIALTDETGLIQGLILAPGFYLVKAFTIVSDTNYKCQKSIPMSFFSNLQGKSVFNP